MATPVASLLKWQSDLIRAPWFFPLPPRSLWQSIFVGYVGYGHLFKPQGNLQALGFTFKPRWTTFNTAHRLTHPPCLLRSFLFALARVCPAIRRAVGPRALTTGRHSLSLLANECTRARTHTPCDVALPARAPLSPCSAQLQLSRGSAFRWEAEERTLLMRHLCAVLGAAHLGRSATGILAGVWGGVAVLCSLFGEIVFLLG